MNIIEKDFIDIQKNIHGMHINKMREIIIFFRKVIAALVCILFSICYYKILKLKIPSISFSFSPFKLSKGSMTIIGSRAIISNHCELITEGRLKIGDNFCMNKYSRISAKGEIVIGHNVTIARFVSILDHDHDYIMVENNIQYDGYSIEPIHIGNNVWIGDKVSITKGVVIGSNVIVGANSVVTNNIPNNVIVAGVPAKILKHLSNE